MSSDVRPCTTDEKSVLCVPFILSLISCERPLIIGLSGVQGAGKSSLAANIAQITSEIHGLKTVVISIDDFYLSHADQLALARDNPENKLIQHRGLPGTHDILLLRNIFSSLRAGSQCRLPAYDKSAQHGSGDRVAENQWRVVNSPGEKKLDLVILEGWCVGFTHLEEDEVSQKRIQGESKTLLNHKLEHLLYVNQKLKDYEIFNTYFDGFIHIDSFNLDWIYDWRGEQEEKLRQKKGEDCAMSPQQVIDFVNNYFPAYELYIDNLRKSFGSGSNTNQVKMLTLIIGKNRQILKVLRR